MPAGMKQIGLTIEAIGIVFVTMKGRYYLAVRNQSFMQSAR